MGHSKYVCDKEKWTCFDLGRWAPPNIEELCELINTEECSFEEFRSMVQEWVDVYNPEKIKALIEYTKSIKPEHYAFAHNEDHLCEEVFDLWEMKKPIFEVGTVYDGNDLWIFGKQFLEQ